MFCIILIWTFALLLMFYMRRRHIVVLGSKLPGPKGYPLLGNALLFYGSPEKVFRKLHELSQRFTKICALWIGPHLVVSVFGHKEAEIILKSKNVVKSTEYNYLRPWLGESILISEGEKFKHNKKLIIPSFCTPNLRQYLEVFSQHCKVLVEKLEKEVDGEEFDIYPMLSLCAMFVLLETSLGVKKEILGHQTMDYVKAVDTIGRCMHIRTYQVWLRPNIIFRFSKLKKVQDKCLAVINPLTDRVICERKKEIEARKANAVETGEQQWPIFLDNFLEAKDEDGLGMSDQEIKDEVRTIMFAGQDTTTGSIGFALCLLGLFQDIQDRVCEEIDAIFGDSNRSMTYDDCKNLKYLEQVIQETWRLYPPIPLIGKKATEDILLGDHLVPKGSTLALIIMLIHRDPEQYPDPESFNPDNFLPERIKGRNPYSFLPFSAGQRTCIGQKYAMLLVKVMMCFILRYYRVYSTVPRNKYKLAAQTTLKRKDGSFLSIKRRK